MDKNLKNILIIIAVLVGLYFLISPYERCLRSKVLGEYNCGRIHSW